MPMSPGLIDLATLERFRHPASGNTYMLLGRFEFVTGTRYLHEYAGDLVAGGQTWVGVSKASGQRLASIGAVEYPMPNVATKVDIVMTGVDADYVRTLRTDEGEVEGRSAELFLLVLDKDDRPVGDPFPIFPDGTMTAPGFKARRGLREVSVTIESFWLNKNFPASARWNDANHGRRHPGDRVFQYTGGQVEEIWP
jgi:hypothetical protein